MPATKVLFYREKKGGKALVLEWLEGLPNKAQDKGVVRIERLEEEGHELRRPEAAPLRDGIYELRWRHFKVQYRILYFFHGQDVTVLAHSIIKEDSAVPGKEIDKAVEKKKKFELDPDTHTYQEETES